MILHMLRLADGILFLSLFLQPHQTLLPAFLISHKIRFRIAVFCASFPPGEAKGAPAPENQIPRFR